MKKSTNHQKEIKCLKTSAFRNDYCTGKGDRNLFCLGKEKWAIQYMKKKIHHRENKRELYFEDKQRDHVFITAGIFE